MRFIYILLAIVLMIAFFCYFFFKKENFDPSIVNITTVGFAHNHNHFLVDPSVISPVFMGKW